MNSCLRPLAINPCQKDSTLKRKNLLLREQILFFKSRTRREKILLRVDPDGSKYFLLRVDPDYDGHKPGRVAQSVGT